MAGIRTATCIADDWATLVEAAGPAALYVVDDDGVVVSWRPSAEAMFGWRADEMLGQPSARLDAADDAAAGRGGPVAVGRQGADRQGPRALQRRKDGTVFTAEVTTAVIHDAGGASRHIRSIRDVTSQLEERAGLRLQLGKLQSELIDLPRLKTCQAAAGALAHELARPLDAAANYLESIAGLANDPTADLAVVREAAEAGARNLIRAGEALHRFQKLVAPDRKRCHREQFLPIVTAAIQRARLALTNPSIAIEARIDPQLFVRANRGAVEQILHCLLANAVQSYGTDECGTVQILAAPIADDLLQISVVDHGRGIPAELPIDRFVPFHGHADGRVGLGLSICPVLVESHGGTLRVQQPSAGGTALLFTLPLSLEVATSVE